MKRKIYYVANSRIPTQRAHGLQIMKTCEALARTGAEVELILPGRFNEMSDDAFTYYRAERIFTVKKLFTVDIAPQREPSHPFFYLVQSLTFAISAFLYLLFRPKDDLIYFRFNHILLAAFSLFRKRNITCEAHFLATGWHKRLLLKNTNIIVVNCAAEEAYGKETNFEKKVLTVPDGVAVKDFSLDISRSEAKQKLGLPPDKRSVIYTGYFYKWKGIDTLMHAAQHLPADTVLVLVGGAENDTAPLRRMAEEMGMHNVIFAGFRPYGEMAMYQRAADCLVLTGSKKYEQSDLFTSPLKLFEYMASGNPIIASRTRAIEEILQSDHNALLVDPDDPKALADGISRILSDHVLSDRLAKQARQDAVQYDWEHRARRILSFIEARASQPKVLYLFAGERQWMVDLWHRGKFADSQFVGLNHLHKFGVRAHFMETDLMNRLRKINFNLAQLPVLFRLRRYDVVFAASNLFFVFLAKDVLRMKKPRFVFYNTFFTNALKRNTSGIYAWMIRRAIRSIDVIWCPSTAQKRFLEKEGFDPNRIVFIPNGVDAHFFKPSDPDLDRAHRYIFAMGKDMGRDYKTLIDAVARLDIKTRIIASPRNLSHIDTSPANVNVSYDVPQDETRAYYRNALFVVMPTHGEDHKDASDCSGQYVLLESMASGKAVIATERSTLKDYIVNEENAVVVPAQDPAALRTAIAILLRSPEQITRLERAARKSVEDDNTTEKLAESLSVIFKS